MNDCKYVKVIYMNFGERKEYESDLGSNEHFLFKKQ